MNKWNAARAEAAEEEEIELEEGRAKSLDEISQEKRRRLQEWKQQLSSEDTERNMNFTPVVGDWRARVAQAKKKKTSEPA